MDGLILNGGGGSAVQTHMQHMANFLLHSETWDLGFSEGEISNGKARIKTKSFIGEDITFQGGVKCLGQLNTHTHKPALPASDYIGVAVSCLYSQYVAPQLGFSAITLNPVQSAACLYIAVDLQPAVTAFISGYKEAERTPLEQEGEAEK